jgi:gliding motility-associated-like protein
MWGRDSFQYRVCNDFGCDSAWVHIYVDPGDKILVYSGFSPNGDKINDKFYIKGIDAYPNNEVIVFNRYGNEVFKKKGYKNDDAWNGDWRGLSLPVGTYYYIVTIYDETTSQYSGYIQIHR